MHPSNFEPGSFLLLTPSPPLTAREYFGTFLLKLRGKPSPEGGPLLGMGGREADLW